MLTVDLTIAAAIIGALWRIALGGENEWAAWSRGARWLRWCWDFNHAEPVLRRSVIMAVCPLICAPIWFSTIPWWAVVLLTGSSVVQWVWPGRDFAVWWSLMGAHGLWGIASAVVLYAVGGVWWAPLIPPFVTVVAYYFSMRIGDDRIGQGAAGAAVFGCITIAVW